MKPPRFLPGIAALFFLLALPAFAGSLERDPQAPVDLPRFKGNYSDFRHVQLLCSSETSGDYISTALCTAAENFVREGVRDTRLGFRNYTGREDGETFTIYVRINSAGTAHRAISVQIEASRYYEQAVDNSAGYRDPARHPRQGKLVMWEESITGIGQGDSLEQPMRQRLRAVLRDFFRTVKSQQ